LVPVREPVQGPALVGHMPRPEQPEYLKSPLPDTILALAY